MGWTTRTIRRLRPPDSPPSHLSPPPASLRRHVRHLGLLPDDHIELSTNLVISRTKAGDLAAAHAVFDRMPQRSVVAWTALISGHARHGSVRAALELFSSMRRSGECAANEHTYGCVLRACTGAGGTVCGEQVQASVWKSGFCGSVFVGSALVGLYSKGGRIEEAGVVFEEMRDRDLVCWNAMVCGYALHGLEKEAFWTFRSMLCQDMVPDCFTLSSVMKACSGGGSLNMVKLAHGFVVKLGFECGCVVAGSLVDSYARCKSLTSARLVYNSLQHKDLISSTALITAYARAGHLTEPALEIFSGLNLMNMSMDGVIMCSVLNICANNAFLNLGKQIHAVSIKRNANDTPLGNALIDMYAKSGVIMDARLAFHEIREKNVISWTSLITGCGKHGCGEEALTLFKEMESFGLKPNDVTFLSVISACSHAGLIGDGWECFNMMCNSHHIVPRDEHYSSVIDLLARGGQLDEAYNMMLKFKKSPPVSVWCVLLGACEAHGNKFLGETVAKHLFAMVPGNAVNYISLSNIYASSGYWNDAFSTRKLMEEKGLKKEVGYSLMPLARKNTSLPLEAS